MTAYTDDDVLAGAEALRLWRVTSDTADAETVLKAVAPAIKNRWYEIGHGEGESCREADFIAAFDEWPDLHYSEDVTAFARKVAAQALRQAADDIYSVDDSSALAEPFRKWLRARAEQIDPMPDTFAGAESERQA